MSSMLKKKNVFERAKDVEDFLWIVFAHANTESLTRSQYVPIAERVKILTSDFKGTSVSQNFL